MTLRPHDRQWSAKGTWVVLVALVAPTVSVLALGRRGDPVTSAAAVSTFVLGCGALLSAGLLVAHGRLAANLDSTLAGGTLGVTAVLVLVGGPGLAHGSATERGLVPWIGPLVCGLALLLAVAVRQLEALPAWVRHRLGAAVLLGGLACAVLVLWTAPTDPRRAGATLALGLTATLLLVSTSSALFREVVTDGDRQLRDLHARLAAAEGRHRADTARLHDATSLVAGVVSATHLVKQLPPSRHRDDLEAVTVTELERLQRLLVGPSGRGPVTVDVPVDEVAGRVALSHRARGRVVVQPRTDVRVRGDADELARLLDILVENAAQHGSADHIALDVVGTGGWVEIAVSDHGPGVPSALRDTVFEWGQRGPVSPGSGMGLFTARALATRLGGDLRLDPAPLGARFVLRLPAVGSPATPGRGREDLAVAHP